MQMKRVAIRPAYPNPQTNQNHQGTVNQTNVCSWDSVWVKKTGINLGKWNYWVLNSREILINTNRYV